MFSIWIEFMFSDFCLFTSILVIVLYPASTQCYSTSRVPVVRGWCIIVLYSYCIISVIAIVRKRHSRKIWFFKTTVWIRKKVTFILETKLCLCVYFVKERPILGLFIVKTEKWSKSASDFCCGLHFLLWIKDKTNYDFNKVEYNVCVTCGPTCRVPRPCDRRSIVQRRPVASPENNVLVPTHWRGVAWSQPLRNRW